MALLYRKMRPISRQKEQNIVALIKKGMSSREIAKSVGLVQSTINRVRRRLSTSVALSKGGRPNIHVHAVNQTVKHGGGSIMFLSCLAYKGLGSLQNIQGRLNARSYIAILEQDLCGTLLAFGFTLKKIIFQQNNANVYTTKIVREWLRKQPFCILEWHAQSAS